MLKKLVMSIMRPEIEAMIASAIERERKALPARLADIEMRGAVYSPTKEVLRSRLLRGDLSPEAKRPPAQS